MKCLGFEVLIGVIDELQRETNFFQSFRQFFFLPPFAPILNLFKGPNLVHLKEGGSAITWANKWGSEVQKTWHENGAARGWVFDFGLGRLKWVKMICVGCRR